MLHKVFRTSVYTVVWLEVKPVAKMACADPQFTFRFLTADEVAKFAKDPSYYIDPSLADGVRNGREVCFAALAGDRLAAFGCYTLGYVEPQQAAGAAMSFPADVAYMSFGFTHPDFRGARLHGLIMGLALQELANAASRSSCRSSPGRIWLRSKAAGGSATSTSATWSRSAAKRAIGFYPQAAKDRGVRFGRNAVRPA